MCDKEYLLAIEMPKRHPASRMQPRELADFLAKNGFSVKEFSIAAAANFVGKEGVITFDVGSNISDKVINGSKDWTCRLCSEIFDTKEAQNIHYEKEHDIGIITISSDDPSKSSNECMVFPYPPINILNYINGEEKAKLEEKLYEFQPDLLKFESNMFNVSKKRAAARKLQEDLDRIEPIQMFLDENNAMYNNAMPVDDIYNTEENRINIDPVPVYPDLNDVWHNPEASSSMLEKEEKTVEFKPIRINERIQHSSVIVNPRTSGLSHNREENGVEIERIGLYPGRALSFNINDTNTGYKCDSCGYIFDSCCFYSIHMNKVHVKNPEMVLRCQICESQFGKNFDEVEMPMQAAVEEFGTTGLSHSVICKYCGKKFISLTHLHQHRGVNHPASQHTCPQCEVSLKREKELENQKRTVLVAPKFVCHICNREFERRAAYTEHMRKHSGVKQYKCNLCPKSFLQPAYLTRHTRIHHEELPFRCEVCKKGYRCARNFENHKCTIKGSKVSPKSVGVTATITSTNVSTHTITLPISEHERDVFEGKNILPVTNAAQAIKMLPTDTTLIPMPGDFTETGGATIKRLQSVPSLLGTENAGAFPISVIQLTQSLKNNNNAAVVQGFPSSSPFQREQVVPDTSIAIKTTVLPLHNTYQRIQIMPVASNITKVEAFPSSSSFKKRNAMLNTSDVTKVMEALSADGTFQVLQIVPNTNSDINMEVHTVGSGIQEAQSMPSTSDAVKVDIFSVVGDFQKARPILKANRPKNKLPASGLKKKKPAKKTKNAKKTGGLPSGGQNKTRKQKTSNANKKGRASVKGVQSVPNVTGMDIYARNALQDTQFMQSISYSPKEYTFPPISILQDALSSATGIADDESLITEEFQISTEFQRDLAMANINIEAKMDIFHAGDAFQEIQLISNINATNVNNFHVGNHFQGALPMMDIDETPKVEIFTVDPAFQGVLAMLNTGNANQMDAIGSSFGDISSMPDINVANIETTLLLSTNSDNIKLEEYIMSTIVPMVQPIPNISDVEALNAPLIDNNYQPVQVLANTSDLNQVNIFPVGSAAVQNDVDPAQTIPLRGSFQFMPNTDNLTKVKKLPNKPTYDHTRTVSNPVNNEEAFPYEPSDQRVEEPPPADVPTTSGTLPPIDTIFNQFNRRNQDESVITRLRPWHKPSEYKG